MPVTAKLSRKLYEKLGDEVANQLVEWFNMVDATYRSDLTSLNDRNFALFDAKLEQRIGELDAKLSQRIAELDAKIEQLVAELDAKLERRVAELRAEMQIGFARLDAKLDQRIAELDARFEQRLAYVETRLTRRMFNFWIAQAATTAALVFAAVKLTTP